MGDCDVTVDTTVLRAQAWPDEPMARRLAKCRALLYQNGMLTQSEMEKIDKRLDRKATEQRGESDFHRRFWKKADG